MEFAENIKDLAVEFYFYAKPKLGIESNPTLVLKHSPENAKNPLGTTAYYQPSLNKITVFITGRHVKDILRSFAHELIHCSQARSGKFPDGATFEQGYAQNDETLRELEREAYLEGNLLFRDWTDERKKS